MNYVLLLQARTCNVVRENFIDILRTLDAGFNLTAADYGRTETYHLLAEISKHAIALRSYIGDDAFTDVSQVHRTINLLAAFLTAYLQKLPALYNPDNLTRFS